MLIGLYPGLFVVRGGLGKNEATLFWQKQMSARSVDVFSLPRFLLKLFNIMIIILRAPQSLNFHHYITLMVFQKSTYPQDFLEIGI